MTKKDLNDDLEEVLVEHSSDVSKVTLFGRLRNYFLAGVLVTAPIAITIYVTWGFLKFLDKKITPLIPPNYNPNTYLPVDIPGLGLIIAVTFFVVIGWITRNFFRSFINTYF